MSKERKAARLTRSDRIARRLRTISSDTSFNLKKAVFEVQVLAIAPVEIHGYVIAQNETGVVFRHRRTSASKRTLISRFNHNEVLEVFAGEGGIGAVTVLDETVLHTYTDCSNPKVISGNIVQFTTGAGETVTVNTDKARIVARAEDEEAKASRGKKSRKSEPKAKAKRTTRKRRSELDDDLDD